MQRAELLAATGARRARRPGGRAPRARRAHGRGRASAPRQRERARRAPCAGARTPAARARAAAGVRRRAAALEHDEHGVDVRHGMEDAARDRAQHAHVARELGDHGRHAVGRRPGRRPRGARRPPSAPSPPSASTPRQLLDRAQDRAGGDAVGKVRDDLRGRRVERARGRASSRRRSAASCSDAASSASRSAGSSERSSSTTWTCAQRAARCSLSTPSPPPISSATSSASSSAARSMTPRMFESIRKFWPSSRFGRIPNCRRRRRLGWVGSSAHHPNRAAALAVTCASSSS